MRSRYAALTAGFTLMVLAACATPQVPIPAPYGDPPKPRAPVSLPTTLSQTSRVCRWAESTGNPPPIVKSDQRSAATDSKRHSHVSIVNWKLIENKTWIKFFPRQGSVVKFNPELAYGEVVNPEAGYNDMELLDFRVVNADQPPASFELPLTSAQLCDEAAPETVGAYFKGPLVLSVSPLQNAEETNISEHVLVYAPLRIKLQDGVKNWWVLLIWHVRSKSECEQLPPGPDQDSCLALLELADLDPSQYAKRAPELLSYVKYPYSKTATKSHNGVIHGFF